MLSWHLKVEDKNVSTLSYGNGEDYFYPFAVVVSQGQDLKSYAALSKGPTMSNVHFLP